jgi:hypothetical protein
MRGVLSLTLVLQLVRVISIRIYSVALCRKLLFYGLTAATFAVPFIPFAVKVQ